MLRMDEINKIKTASFVQEKSTNKIANQFNRSWATVDKYLTATSSDLANRGKRLRDKIVITNEVIKKIEEFIDDEILRKVHRKQRYTSVYIFKKLKKDGSYKGSERQLRKAVRDVRNKKEQQRKKNPSFLDLNFKHGHYLQLDHGEATVEMGGVDIQGYLFVATIPGLVMRYCQFFLTKEAAAWGEFHERVFRFFGGVFENCIYDNDSALVIASTKEFTALFEDIIAHYNFKVILCNEASGWEKGAVENSVGYCRRNFLAGTPKFDGLELINEHLLKKSTDDIVEGKHYETGALLSDGWKILSSTLKPIPDPKEWGVCEDLHVNSRQVIRYKNYRYSVPEKYVGAVVKCFITTGEVKIYDQQNDHIFTHKRRYLEEDDALVIDHFYEQLSRKPGAFDFAKVVQKHGFSKDLSELRSKLFNIREKLDAHPNTEFINILKLQRKSSVKEFEDAIKLSLSYGGVTCNAIEMILKQIQISEYVEKCPKELLPENCQLKFDNQFNIEQYNLLF